MAEDYEYGDDTRSRGEEGGQSEDERRRAVEEEIARQYREKLGRDPDQNERQTDYENYEKYGGEALRKTLNDRATNPDGEEENPMPQYPSFNMPNGGGWPGGSPMNSWLGQMASNQNQYMQMLQQQMEQANAAQRAREAQLAQEAAARKAKADELFNTLKGRSQQALSVSPEDPVIAAQVNAYSADQERARRNLMSDAAERGRPLSDVQQAMSTERVGQATGSLRAELMAREYAAKRAEIADALTSMGGMLSGDQVAQLQQELAGIDNAIKLQQSQMGAADLDLRRELGLGDLGLGWGRIDLDRELGQGGLQNDLLRTMLSNQQFYADLGLRGQTQDDYYDLVRRGRLGNSI